MRTVYKICRNQRRDATKASLRKVTQSTSYQIVPGGTQTAASANGLRNEHHVRPDQAVQVQVGVGAQDDRLEREADRAVDRVVAVDYAGAPVNAAGASQHGLRVAAGGSAIGRSRAQYLDCATEVRCSVGVDTPHVWPVKRRQAVLYWPASRRESRRAGLRIQILMRLPFRY